MGEFRAAREVKGEVKRVCAGCRSWGLGLQV